MEPKVRPPSKRCLDSSELAQANINLSIFKKQTIPRAVSPPGDCSSKHKLIDEDPEKTGFSKFPRRLFKRISTYRYTKQKHNELQGPRKLLNISLSTYEAKIRRAVSPPQKIIQANINLPIRNGQDSMNRHVKEWGVWTVALLTGSWSESLWVHSLHLRPSGLKATEMPFLVHVSWCPPSSTSALEGLDFAFFAAAGGIVIIFSPLMATVRN